MTDFKQNLEKLGGYLDRFKGAGIQHRIGGEPVAAASQELFDSVSPVDGSVICTVARGNAEDIARATAAAKAAFADWRDMPGTERKKILHRVADLIVARADEIALLECWDTGQALRFMSKA
ncbi:MAG: aldehyde dehydrogenase family protein, partial [Hyphomicrobiaceae bacterium]